MAQVKAAAEAWVNARNRAYQTADYKELSDLSVPDSQAYGEAGQPRENVLHTHRGFITTSTIFQSEVVNVFTDVATATVTFTLHGTDVTYPGLQPLGPPTSATETFKLEFELIDGRWLVNTVH